MSPNAPKTRLFICTGARVGDGRVGSVPESAPAPLPESAPAPLPESAPAPLPESAPPPPASCPPPPQLDVGDDELRGFTVVAVKSAALLSVSVHPAPARTAAVVLLSVAVGPL